VPTMNATDKVIMNFLETNIFARFGCSRKLVTKNAQEFKSKSMIDLCGIHNIALTHSMPYYPQGNGLVESSNKTLIKIIKKLLTENKKSWDSKLKYSLWADKINTKRISLPRKITKKNLYPLEKTIKKITQQRRCNTP
jgi:transposase InsO family protein